MKKCYLFLILLIGYQLQAQSLLEQTSEVANIQNNQTTNESDSGSAYPSEKIIANGHHNWATMAQIERFQTNTAVLDSNLNNSISEIFDGSVSYNLDSNFFQFTSTNGLDVFILKLDSNGNLLWVKNLSGNTSLVNFLLALDSNLTFNLGGQMYRTADLALDSNLSKAHYTNLSDDFVLKLDSNGVFHWTANAHDKLPLLDHQGLEFNNYGSYNLLRYLGSLMNSRQALISQNIVMLQLDQLILDKVDSGKTQMVQVARNASNQLLVTEVIGSQYGTSSDSGVFANNDSGTVARFEQANLHAHNNDFVQVVNNQSNEITSIATADLDKNEDIPTLQFYPNPTKDRLNIQTNEPIININILSITGAVVKTTRERTFSVNDLSNGVYYLQVQMENGLITEKFIKE